MRPQPSSDERGLRGRTIVITRPVGTAGALVRQVRRRGGTPLLLPGMALRGPLEVAATRAALRVGLADELMVFSSPAAVRHAAALLPLRTSAIVLAVGQGTAQALRRHGLGGVLAPAQQDSAGLLAHPALARLRGRRVTLVDAPGGRGVLREQLVARGARLREVHVYRRVPPRLDRRHVDALLRLPASARVLLSSAEALRNLCRSLPPPALRRLRAAIAVVSSERLASAAQCAGFARIVRASSALAEDLLAAAAR